MMKKVGIVFLVLLLCLLSVMGTGCGQKFVPDTSPEYKFETDCQYNYRAVSKNFLTESEDSYYYIDDNAYIHVIDKQTMRDTFLCGKPNCLHGADLPEGTVHENFECNAYVHLASCGTICYYEDALYVIMKKEDKSSKGAYPVFTKIAADGSGRKELFPVTYGLEDDLVVAGYDFFIHRGIVYFSATYSLIDEDTYSHTEVDYRIYSYNLATKKSEKIYQQNTDVTVVPKEKIVSTIAIGNNLYLEVCEEEDTDTWRIDLSAKEVTTFAYGRKIIPVDDKLLYYYVDFEMSGEEKNFLHWVETSDMDGSNRKEYSSLDFNDVPMWIKQIQSDGNNVFVTDNNAAPEATEIRVYDFHSGEHTATIPFPDKVSPYGDRTIVSTQDGKLLMFSLFSYDENGVLPRKFFYCNISDIGTDNFQWYEVEKVN